MKKVVSSVMLVLVLINILIYAFNVQPVKSESSTIIVPDDYPTIQEAIDHANEGDTIYVRAGVYYEHNFPEKETAIIINKTVSLVGEDKSCTVIDGKYSVVFIIYIMADNVTVSGFTIQNSGWIMCDVGGGVFISHSNRNRIVNNIIRNTQYGINLYSYTSNNYITDNIFMDNGNGIHCCEGNNMIYHNNFIRSTVAVYGASNTWDNGYPSGGNYWDDYNGADLYSGVFQNETGSDWIGDTPYVKDENNIDRYPLMKPWNWPLLGDIVCDFKVDMRDIATAALAFGSYQGHLGWNPLADITLDGLIDIFDLVIVAINFAKTYP